jgi:hypothetical protein
LNGIGEGAGTDDAIESADMVRVKTTLDIAAILGLACDARQDD